MFGRFDDSARKVMALARKEAQRFGHDVILPEHVLIGLLDVGGVASYVLATLGVDLKSLRRKAGRLVGSEQSVMKLGKIPFSAETQKALEETEAESGRLGDGQIGTEHLLLGLMSGDMGSRVAGLIEELGVKRDVLRTRIADVLGDEQRIAEASRFPPVGGRPIETVVYSWRYVLNWLGFLAGFCVGVVLTSVLDPLRSDGLVFLMSMIAPLLLGLVTAWLGRWIGARLDGTNGAQGGG